MLLLRGRTGRYAGTGARSSGRHQRGTHDAAGVCTRAVLRNGHYTTEQAALDQPGMAWSAIPVGLSPGTHPLLPPRHLLTFESTEDEGEWLVMVVFGGWPP